MSFERLEPETPEWEAYIANHLHRYRFAGDRLAENGCRRILDAACGVGYGSLHLSRVTGAEVVGVDRDPKALEIAERQFNASGVRYVVDDCESLRAVDESGPFDALVSFETLEHLHEPQKFLVSARARLAPGGIALLSVPNAAVTSSADWEFHHHDFTAEDFQESLEGAGFRGIELFGQFLTPLGLLREQVRAEINRLRSNPFVRFGTWIQRRVRSRPSPPPPLPEQLADLEFRATTAPEIRERGTGGPFVILAVAHNVSD